MSSVNFSTERTLFAFPSLSDQTRLANDSDNPHHPIENLLASRTHRDDLPNHGLGLTEMPEKLEDILSQGTTDLENHLKTFLDGEKTDFLNLISLDEKDHLTAAITIKTNKEGALTFQQSSLTPAGSLAEIRTGSLIQAGDKHDLLQTLSSTHFQVLSADKPVLQHPDDQVLSFPIKRPSISPRKSILKTRQTGAEPLNHSPAKAKKSVKFSPENATISGGRTLTPQDNNVKIDQNIVGAMNTKNNNMVFDHCEIEHKPGVNENKFVLNADGGDFKIKNGSVVYGKIKSSTGKINIDNAITSDDIMTRTGEIQVHSFSGTLGTLYSLSGKVDVNNSNAGAINNKHGVTSIYKSTIKRSVNTDTGPLSIEDSIIKKDVNAGSGAFSINKSIIEGKLTAHSNNLKIGKNCTIDELVIKHSNPNAPATQHITLDAGTVLNKLSFEAKECILTLKENAKFKGGSIPGLTIINSR